MILRAGLCGIKNGEKLPAPVDQSMRHMTEAQKAEYEKLPLSLEEAVECAKGSSFINEDEVLRAVSERFLSLVSSKEM